MWINSPRIQPIFIHLGMKYHITSKWCHGIEESSYDGEHHFDYYGKWKIIFYLEWNGESPMLFVSTWRPHTQRHITCFWYDCCLLLCIHMPLLMSQPYCIVRALVKRVQEGETNNNKRQINLQEDRCCNKLSHDLNVVDFNL